jgi:hypothetical protein
MKWAATHDRIEEILSLSLGIPWRGSGCPMTTTDFQGLHRGEAEGGGAEELSWRKK